MTNDNKKINDLVSESDDDTSELEVLSEDALNEIETEFEADAATQAFETLSRDRAENDSIAALRSELHERDDNIDRLEFELQQFRSRAKGLEKELEAREAVTRHLSGELEQQKRIVAEGREQLQAREERLEALDARLEERASRIGELERELEVTRAEAESAISARADLDERRAADLRELESLRATLAEEQSRRQWAEDAEQALGEKLATFEEQQREANELIASLKDYIEGRKARWEQQDRELGEREKILRDQQKDIERLTRDVRHSTERLDREKSAREQSETAAAALKQENAALRGAIEQRDAALGDLKRSAVASRDEIAALRQALEEKSSALHAAQEELEQARHRLDEERSAIASLRDEIAGAQATNAERQALLDERTRALTELEARITGTETELRDARSAREDLQQRLERERGARGKLEANYECAAAEAERLQVELGELRTVAAEYAALRQSHSQLLGKVASQERLVDELRQQLGKTESYADTLRDKLQRQIADAEARSAQRETLEKSLAAATARIEELDVGLARETQRKSELADELDRIRKEFEEEIGRVRSELDEARETVAESQRVNERLTADLVESSGHRRTLEAKLSEFDESHRAELQLRTDEAARLKLRLEDYEQKLAHKDAALKALLAEFSSKPTGAAGRRQAAERDAEDVVHRLPLRRGNGDRGSVDKASVDKSLDKGGGDESGGDRDRVTRLLVGTIEGQKLRFPLFKDKLTIGRTAHNDIQIKAQYISRRHAVIVTENDQTRIVDWGSKNGIYVNGIRVTEKPLRNGDIVTVGTAEFVFEERPKR